MSVYTKPALPVAGSHLAVELCTFLRAQHIAPVQIDEAVAYIEEHGTADGCPSLEPDDQAEADVIIRGRTGSTEYASAADWPRAWDRDMWSLTDTVPVSAPCPPAEPFALDFEPTHADRLWVASEGRVNLFDEEADRRADELWAEALLTAGLVAFPMPVCGGSPDAKPVKVRGVRSRVQTDWTDADQYRHHGAV
jgi:hypothetical protein